MEVASILSQKYPFGREHEASVQLLFRTFCNNLFLGQFELARASLNELHNEKSFLKTSVVDVLRKPLDRWCRDHVIHSLTWPTFLEYQSLEDDSVQNERLKSDIEFCIILTDSCSGVSPSILQELYDLKSENIICPSDGCREYLIQILLNAPETGINLLSYITTHENKEFMDSLVIDTLHQCIPSKTFRHVIFILLSRTSLDLENYSTKSRISDVLSAILTAISTQHDSAFSDYVKLLTSVLSQPNDSLYQLLISLDTDVSVESVQLNSVRKWRDRALATISGHDHFFDCLMSEASMLIKERRYAELVVVLTNQEWRPLLPFFFHLAWRQCNKPEDSHNLTTAFSKVADEKLRLLIDQHQRIDVIEQSLNISSESSKRPDISSAILSTGSTKSVLQALLVCLDDLSSWSRDKMMQTLGASTAYALLQPSKGAGQTDSLSLDQLRDINLFNAFYILNSLVDVLIASSDNTTPGTQAFTDRYLEYVLPRLRSIKQLLSNLRPLSLRLEVLEDLFTLLFTTAADLTSSCPSQSPNQENPCPKIMEKPDTVASDEDQYYSAREALSPQKPFRVYSAPATSIAHGKNVSSAAKKLYLTSENGEASSGEENSSSDSLAVGFIANEFIIRDILAILKEALSQLTSSRLKYLEDKKLKQEEDSLTEMTLTSVTEDNFLPRSSTLQRRVSEGIWRQQLILQDSISKDFGSYEVHSKQRDQQLDDDGYSEYERSLLTPSRKSPPSIQKLSISSADSEVSSEQYTGGSSTGGAISGQSGTRSKRLKKRRDRVNSITVKSRHTSRHNLINRMLSTPTSLLNLCIKRENHVQAQQVLKILNLADSKEGKDLAFSQSYQIFLKDLSSQPAAKYKHVSGLSSGLELSDVRRAVSATLSITEQSNKAEQLATAAVMPSVINSVDDKIARLFSKHFNSENVKAMVLLDLACVGGCPNSTAHLLKQAQNSLSVSQLDSKDKVPGYHVLLKQCLDVNELANASDQQLVKSLLTFDHENFSIRGCFLSIQLSPDSQQINEQLKPLIDISKDMCTIERALTAWKRSGREEQLMTTLPVKSLVQTLNRYYPNKGQHRSYLADFHRQIKILHAAIVDNTSPASGQKDNHFTVLEDGPTMIMGRLIFENNVEPERLEAVAAKVKLDLTHVIVRSCCLPVRCKPVRCLQSACPDNPYTVKKYEYGYRAVLNPPLNLGSHSEKLTTDPLKIVSELLYQLLEIVDGELKETLTTVLQQSHCHNISQSKDFVHFSSECRQLHQVDLDLLKTDQQKRAFFVNLHNLLCLHGTILYMASINKQQAQDNSISQLLALHMITSYIVGQLGVCSVFELQQFLLKASSKVQQLDLSVEHPWFCYAPEYNPCTVFLLYEGNVNILPIKCVTPDSITQDLVSSLNHYVAEAVILDPQEQHITLPHILERVYTCRSEPADLDGSTVSYKHAGLLNWILKHQKAGRWSVQKRIMDLLESQSENKSAKSTTRSQESGESESLGSEILASVTILPSFTRLGYSTKPEDGLMLLLNPELSLTQIDEKESSGELSASFKVTSTDSRLHQAKFTISQVAIDYIRAKSPIVAILLDVIHEDMHVSTGPPNDDRDPPASPTGHFCCDTLNNDYPVLCRYLSESLIPLCAHIDGEVDSLKQISQMELPEQVKSAILTHKSAKLLERAAYTCINELGTEDRYDLIVKVIDRLRALTFNVPEEWLAVRDYSLIQCASERVSNESLVCIKQLSCPRLQAHIAIACLHKSRWTVDKCLQILPLCERRLRELGDNSLIIHVDKIIQKMAAFHRIMLHAQAKQDISIAGCPEKVVEELAAGWQNVAEHLAEKPSYVFYLLFDAEEFLFAKNLVERDLDSNLKQLVLTNYLIHVLDKEAQFYTSTQVISSKLKEEGTEWTFDLCILLLKGLETAAGIQHVTQFMINELLNIVDKEEQQKIELCHLGAQMLTVVDESSQTQYRSVIFSPLLFLEQLLMNAKIAWVEKAITLMRSYDWSCDLARNTCCDENINELLCTYAQKAVDFPVITTSTTELAGNVLTGNPVLSPFKNVVSMAKIGSPVAMSPLQRSALGTSLSKSPATYLTKSLSKTTLSRVTTAPATLVGFNEPTGSLPAQATGRPTDRGRQTFTIPENVPTRDNWVPDEAVAKCMVCQLETFSMFNRRHHCRRCGRVVCSSCSSRTALIGDRNVRVCDDCYKSLNITQKNPMTALATSSNADMLSSSIPNRDRQPGDLLSGSPMNGSALLPELVAVTPEWILCMEEHQNEDVRSEFFYDHAPSVSLCAAILRMYNDNIECGKHMLSLCQKLSLIIKPIKPESINQEVDYNLVISMMKFLLLSAKLLFVKEHYTDGISLCETYSNRVDVLSLLLFACYLDLPTVDELASIDSVRRLRDKLTEDERPELALEISTKFGLETTAIWSAWGLTCLRKADYAGARDKFSKVLKPPMDKSSQSIAYSKLLSDIVNTIEGQASQGGAYTQASILASIKGLTSNNTDIGKTVPMQCSDGVQMDENQVHIQECLFYLKTYGNHQMVINFYREHGFWQNAVQYCFDKKCHPDIFLSSLFQPAVIYGELLLLQDQILLLDSTLRKSAAYLTAVCRQLSRSSQYHTLYQMQLFLKDYIRAAMTCIQVFYLKGATNYADLFNRLQYLHLALDHLQSYLYPGKSEKLSQTKTQISRGSDAAAVNLRLSQSENEIKRQMSTINLQIEVTKVMNQPGSRNQQVATLFGDLEERIKVAVKVILSGKNVKDGFELGFRIIQDFQLPYTKVYGQAAAILAECSSAANVKQLLTCIKETALSDTEMQDAVVLAAIRSCPPDSKDCDSLIKLLQTDSAKIEGLILSRKLRQAYLLAVKYNSVDVIRRIAEEAEKYNQSSVKSICEKYLNQNKQ